MSWNGGPATNDFSNSHLFDFLMRIKACPLQIKLSDSL